MNLENRLFSKYYPQKSSNKQVIPYSHGVKSTGFHLMPNFFYDMGIESPSTQGGQRHYELSFAKNISNEHLPENYFRGLLGESLMRIVVMEFLRRKQQKLGIKEFNIFKKNSQENTILKSEHYALSFCSRYNTQIFNSGNNNPFGEYDGMIKYETSNKKGLLLMEAKTGQEGLFLNPIKNEAKITKKYCGPIKELFPNYDIDLLFMGTTGTILKSAHRNRRLKHNFSLLNDLLYENNTGLIMFEFPISRNELLKMGRKMAKYHPLRMEETPKLEPENHFVENGKYIWFMKGKRITRIFEKTKNNNWNELYSLR